MPHIHVPLRNALLDSDGALDGSNDGRELQEYSVTGGLDDPAAVESDNWINGGSVLAESLCGAGLVGGFATRGESRGSFAGRCCVFPGGLAWEPGPR